MIDEPIAAVYIAPLTDTESTGTALVLARDIRQYGISCIMDGREVRIKHKLKAANNVKSYFTVILGPDDLLAGTIQLRDMDESTQLAIPLAGAARHIAVQMLTEAEVRKIEVRLAFGTTK
jgi:histidyl-tRNA synthetase